MNRIPSWLRAAAWTAVLAWAATIFWLSSRTGPEIEEMNVFEISDKIAHFAAFFAGAVPLFCAFKWSFPQAGSRALLLTIGYIAIYGAIDETHQLFTANRSGADIYDWMADALGGTAGAFTTAFLYARFKSPHRTTPERD